MKNLFSLFLVSVACLVLPSVALAQNNGVPDPPTITDAEEAISDATEAATAFVEAAGMLQNMIDYAEEEDMDINLTPYKNAMALYSNELAIINGKIAGATTELTNAVDDFYNAEQALQGGGFLAVFWYGSYQRQAVAHLNSAIDKAEEAEGLAEAAEQSYSSLESQLSGLIAIWIFENPDPE